MVRLLFKSMLADIQPVVTNLFAVSTYSLREHLGPVVIDLALPDGQHIHHEFDNPKLLDLPDFPARAKQVFGVDAVETVAMQFKGLDDPELDAFAAGLKEHGVTLVNAAIDSGDLQQEDADGRAADVALIKRWIERFTDMGARFVRVNASSPLASHSPTPPDHLVEALRELSAFAAERGARLLVENHGGPSSDPQWMNALLDATAGDCGLLLDLGNFDVLFGPIMEALFGGLDAEELFDRLVTLGTTGDLSSVYSGLEALAGRAELVHVKAHYVGDDGAVGAVDVPRALGILRAHGYDGPLTVEYEGHGGDPWAKTTRVLELTRTAA